MSVDVSFERLVDTLQVQGYYGRFQWHAYPRYIHCFTATGRVYHLFIRPDCIEDGAYGQLEC